MVILGIVILFLIWCLICAGEFVDFMEDNVKREFIRDIQNDRDAPRYMKNAARRISVDNYG